MFLESSSHLLTISSALLVSSFILYSVYTLVYNIFLHPLRNYPGPLLWRVSRIPYDYHAFNGTIDQKVKKLHEQYGPNIRVAPGELSFTQSEAFKDILAHNPGKAEFPKAPVTLPPNGLPSILSAGKEDHARIRRLLAHAFSEKGLRDQESHITHYVDLLVDRLQEKAKDGQFTDMVAWFNCTVFDVIGDLAFGESFHSLENRQTHEWIPTIAANVRFVIMASILKRRGLGFLDSYLLPEGIQEARKRNYEYTQAKVNERAEYGADRGDFWDRVIIKSENDNGKGEGLSKGEMLNNASVLVLGGSETSATTLSGTTYLLLNHPNVMKKLATEIRSTFQSSDDITLFSVSKLKYASAVLEETMRMYPPVPRQAVRVVPKGGSIVCGQVIPEDTIVSTSQYSAFNINANFHRADEFIPERWLEDAAPEFANDDKAAFIPFSLGTRNCIGRNLAYAEMRLILAKLIYNFDLELDSQRTGDWFDQKAWAIWQKKPLWVKVSSAQH